MIWLKSVLVGLLAGIATIVAIVVAMATFHMNSGQGGGIVVAYMVMSPLFLVPAALAFALGFRWMLRRQRRRQERRTS